MKKCLFTIAMIIVIVIIVMTFNINSNDEISYKEAINIANKLIYEMNTKTPKMEEVYIKYLKHIKTYASKLEYDGKSYYKVYNYLDIVGTYGGAYNIFIDSHTGELLDIRIED